MDPSTNRNGSRRVVITGLGLISPLGSTPDALWQNLAAGQTGVRPMQAIPASPYPMPFAAEALDFTGEIDNFGEVAPDVKKAIRKGVKLMCRETQMGVAAAQRALADAKVVGGVAPERIGVSFGAGYMMTEPAEYAEGIRKCMTDGAFQFPRWGNEGMRQVTPLWLLKYLPNMPACHIAIYNDLRGPNNSLTHGESAAHLAIGEAFHVIARGSADAMVAGATGTKVHLMRTIQTALQEELASGVPPESASRPFDKDRSGSVVGEGAGCVILEERAAAEKRGAKIYGEVVGAGSSCAVDRNHVGRRDVALANAIRQALRYAGVTPSDLSFIHAHGTGTRTGDVAEAKAMAAALGEAAAKIPVVAAKSAFGNLGAGSGAVELAASLLALQHGQLFPLLNYQTPDPECLILPAKAEMPAGKLFLNLSVNGRGQASCLLVRAG